jgi:hypothetical protein
VCEQALFAIPGIGIDPIWYPAISIPLVLLSVCAAFFAEKLAKFRERKGLLMHQDHVTNSGRPLMIPSSWRNRQPHIDLEGANSSLTNVDRLDIIPPITDSPISPSMREFSCKIIIYSSLAVSNSWQWSPIFRDPLPALST